MNYQNNSIYSRIPPATLNIIIVNVLVWLASLVLPRSVGYDLVSHFGMHYFASSDFNPIQLLTYMFLHDPSSIAHLFFNMFGVYMFGVVLEQVWGWKKYLFFYFISGIGAALMQQIVWAISYVPVTEAFNAAIAANNGGLLQSIEPTLRRFFSFGNLSQLSLADMIQMKQIILNAPNTIGASGALFGILFAFGWMFPDVKMFIMFIPIPIRARIFVIIYAVIELFLGISNVASDNVAHFAHLGGALVAIIMVLIWRKRGRLFSQKI